MAFKKKFAPRRKFCRFCADKDLPLMQYMDYITPCRRFSGRLISVQKLTG